MTPDVAIAHGELLSTGGAENVAIDLARVFDAPIYASPVNQEVVPSDIRCIDICEGPIESRTVSLLNNFVPLRNLYYALKWQHVRELYDYDVVILAREDPSWFVPSDEQAVIRYVHNTPSWFSDPWTRNSQKIRHRVFATFNRVLSQHKVVYPNVYAANSELTAFRLERYLGVPQDDIEVIYPGVKTNTYGPDHGTGDNSVYLAYSRLVKRKNLEELIRAFNHLGQDNSSSYQLVVGGEGPRRTYLERLAKKNVTFRGYLKEDEKRQLLADAKALIFTAQNEDFGLVPIEAMASGTPVIGVNDGFTRYQVQDGRNGYTYERGEPGLRDAVKKFERDGVKWSSQEIQEFAAQFSSERFASQMRDLVEKAISEATISHQLRGTVSQ